MPWQCDASRSYMCIYIVWSNSGKWLKYTQNLLWHFVIKTTFDVFLNVKLAKRSRMASLCVLMNLCEYQEGGKVTQFSDWSDILSSESSYFISSEIHKACIAPQKRATYYIFIKRKHIQTLIFKWIFKRAYNHTITSTFNVLSFTFAWPKHMFVTFGTRFVRCQTRCTDSAPSTTQLKKKERHTHLLLLKRPPNQTTKQPKEWNGKWTNRMRCYWL